MAETPMQSPIRDLAEGARRHYEELSSAACNWSSIIPQAIDAWEREKLRTAPEPVRYGGDGDAERLEESTGRLFRNESTEEGRRIWAAVDKTAERAPSWMKQRCAPDPVTQGDALDQEERERLFRGPLSDFEQGCYRVMDGSDRHAVMRERARDALHDFAALLREPQGRRIELRGWATTGAKESDGTVVFTRNQEWADQVPAVLYVPATLGNQEKHDG